VVGLVVLLVDSVALPVNFHWLGELFVAELWLEQYFRQEKFLQSNEQ
jgi:hypothetical protein